MVWQQGLSVGAVPSAEVVKPVVAVRDFLSCRHDAAPVEVRCFRASDSQRAANPRHEQYQQTVHDANV